EGYPLLGPGFESSLPGLHFLGAPAARSFGPVSRFVSGTPYAARALARRIAGKARYRLEPVFMSPTTDLRMDRARSRSEVDAAQCFQER
ncbi:MAG TPA: hypothetical protein VK495_18190, partial [Steroidobacteraceae bacterium]|nr:hypothetical protein [Steroidobacteraceae bacterium]